MPSEKSAIRCFQLPSIQHVCWTSNANANAKAKGFRCVPSRISKQGGAVLVLALLFLWLVSLLVLESIQINRVHFQAAENFKLSKKYEALADKTCNYAHRAIQNILSGSEGKNLNIPFSLSSNLSRVDLHNPDLGKPSNQDGSSWQHLLTVEEEYLSGSARYNLTSIDYKPIDMRHRHFARYGGAGTGLELVEVVFQLRCEGGAKDRDYSSARIDRDYRLMMLRSI